MPPFLFASIVSIKSWEIFLLIFCRFFQKFGSIWGYFFMLKNTIVFRNLVSVHISPNSCYKLVVFYKKMYSNSIFVEFLCKIFWNMVIFTKFCHFFGQYIYLMNIRILVTGRTCAAISKTKKNCHVFFCWPPWPPY